MDTRMRSKARKQRNFMLIFSAPIKIPSKVGEYYVKGMEYCNNRVRYDALVGWSSAPGKLLPKSFRVNSFPAFDDEEFKQTLFASSKKHTRKSSLQTSIMGRSCNASVGKIGRIDEDKPFAYEEDGLKEELMLSPRSRSQVVRSFVYQK